MQHGDTSWFPKPPPKPLKAPSTTMLFVGLIVVIGIIGAAVSFATAKHSKAKTTTQQVTTGAQDLSRSELEQQNRQAFNDCMKAVGGGSIGGTSVGRFGTRPDPNKFRAAFNACRAVLQGGAPPTTATVPTSTAPPPVA